MWNLDIDKRGLQVLLQAVKTGQTCLLEFSHQIQERGQESPAGLAWKVRGVRSFRNFLEQLARKPDPQLGFTIEGEERDLLASCLFEARLELDHRLNEPILETSEVLVLEQTRKQILDLLEQLGVVQAFPLIPHEDSPSVLNQECPPRDIDIDIDIDSLESIDFSGPPAMPESREMEEGVFPDLEDGPPGPPPSPLRHDFMDPQALGPEDPAPPTEAGEGDPGAVEALPDPAPGESVMGSGSHLFMDPELLSDPRVRTQIRLDLFDLQKAQKSGNLRMTLIHLRSLLEGLLMDQVLSHPEMGIEEPEEGQSFDLFALASRFLPGPLEESRRQALGLLATADRLLSPSFMLRYPVILTEPMVAMAEAFLRWFMKELGYRHMSQRREEPEKRLHGAWRPTRRRASSGEEQEISGS